MAIYFLALYIATILIRPMDWWLPLLDYELVTIGAVLVCLVGFNTMLARFPVVWKLIPQAKAAGYFFGGVVLSQLTNLWLAGVKMAFNEFGKVIVFFFLILLLVRKRKDFEVLLSAFLICTVWLGVHAIMQHHLGSGFGGQAPLARKVNRITGEIVYQAQAYGTFDDPNDLCVVLVVSIALFYAQFRRLKNPLMKAISLGCVGIVGYGAWCTNSRGGVMAIFGMLATYILARVKGFSRYVILAVALFSVTVVAPSRFAGGATEGHDRAVLWGDGINMFKSHPIFGVGFHQFVDYSDEAHVAHNSYIHTLAETGLVGYLPFFCIICLTVVQVRRLIALKDLITRDQLIMLTGLYAALAGYLTGLYFISRQYQHILYVIIGLVVSGCYVVSEENGLHKYIYGQLRKDLKFGVSLGLGSVVFLWIMVRIAYVVS